MRFAKGFDWLLVVVTFALCGCGLALIYSVLQPLGDEASEVSYFYLTRQSMWLGVATLGMVLAAAVPFRIFESLAGVIYVLCLTLLLVTMLMPTGPAGRWLSLGPFRVQPSELTKVAVIFMWARVLSGTRGDPNRARSLMVVLTLFAIPFLMVLQQPDLGTALVFLGVLLPILYWRGVAGLHIVFILSPIVSSVLIIYGENVANTALPFGIFIVCIFVVAYLRRSQLVESVSLVVANVGVALALPIAWDQLQGYQQRRVLNFLDPGADRLGAGWQVIQSKIAIGSGGFTGKGYLAGTQKALEFIPEKHTDFIFSVLGEEFGFAGATFVLLMFGTLIVRALVLAQKAKSQFASTACIGIAAYFLFQVVVNMAMTMGMAPVTGIPLPFLSYGGSSLVVSCFLVGFLVNVSMRWYEY